MINILVVSLHIKVWVKHAVDLVYTNRMSFVPEFYMFYLDLAVHFSGAAYHSGRRDMF